MASMYYITLFLCSVAVDTSLIVKTHKGEIQGKTLNRLGREINTFRAIPYAKPPVGELRFLPPQPAEPWNETVDATDFKTSCWQKHESYEKAGDLPFDEDCLYLNVMVPHRIPNPGLAVMVWIHGGGFTMGTSGDLQEDCLTIVAIEDVICVHMNYRLGVFGFLSMGVPDAPGNLALLDQQLAMKWVHDNIVSFGGDPDKTTIFGVSAGGASVGFHLLAPGSRDLFQRAIIQSGYVLNPKRAYISGEEARNRASQFAQEVHCDANDTEEILRCLREKSAEELMLNHGLFTVFRTPFPPIIDGIFIEHKPRMLAKMAKFKKTPLLIGTIEHETGHTTFRAAGIPGLSIAKNFQFNYGQFHGIVGHCFPSATDVHINAIVAQYVMRSVNSEPSYFREILMDITGDYSYVCPSVELAELFSDLELSVYYYEFDHRPSISTVPLWNGATHADDCPFVFGVPLVEGVNNTRFTEEERALSRKMIRYWANFVRTGNPNTESENEIDENEWPVFGEDGKYIVLNGNRVNGPAVRTKLRGEYCDFWKTQSIYTDNQNLEEPEKDEL